MAFQCTNFAFLRSFALKSFDFVATLLSLATMVVLAVLWPCIPLAFAEPGKPTVKIGVIVPLSGDMAMHGVEVQHAMELALAELDGSKTTYSYELLFEDNQLDGAKSAAAAHRLIDLEKVDVVATLWPPTALVVAPISEKAQVLHYTIVWDPEIAKSNKLVLSHQAMVSSIARATLKLLKSQGKSRIAFLHLEESGFNIGAGYIRSLAGGEGVELVSDEAFNPQDRDFRSLLAKVDKKTPDSYLVWSVMPSIDLVIKQIRDRSPSAFITGYLDYSENVQLIQGAVYVSEMYVAEGFAKRYQDRFGVAPQSKGPNAYDITKLLIAGFEHFPTKKPTALELKGYLTTIKNWDGAVGNFSIDKDGNSSYAPVVRRVVGANRPIVQQ